MPVNSTHPEYDRNLPKWKLVRDVLSSDVKKYIKDIDPTDKPRCERYKDDAQFTNFTARTKNGLVGAIFRKDIVADLPASISYLIQDCTGDGTSLNKLAQEVVGEVLPTGRYGLLVDYPASADNLTVQEVESLNLKARICRYIPEAIINWNVQVIGGNTQLAMVVLSEHRDTLGEDGFQWVSECYYRVLRMVGGTYIQSLYDKDGVLLEEYTPLDSNGNPWTLIPFVFVGSEDNDSKVDPAPLYDLARLNIGHLRNSADYEESVHITGQPTMIISTEYSTEQFAEANPDGVKIGARRGHLLGPGGSAEFLQASPNQLADVAMKRKEEQAVMIGARLVTPIAENETAEAARMRYTGENSALAVIADNVEEALTKCMEYALMFMGGDGTLNIKINKEFFEAPIDPQLLMGWLQMVRDRIVTPDDIRDYMRKHGAIPDERTNEEIAAELQPIEVAPESPLLNRPETY